MSNTTVRSTSLTSAPAFLSLSMISSGLTFVLVALGLCWAYFFNRLRGEWQINPQYSFGYIVPVLCAVLFWRRWPDRPTIQMGNSKWGYVITLGLLLLHFPITLFAEANPEWRLLYWINAVQVVGLTACLLYRIGGRRWIFHFGMPLLFALIAVPWPMGIEQSVIQGLMKSVAGATVEIANLLSIPAVQHGNLIEVGVGLVGIDEACSGVRSLQSALMLSLFLGEMYRFKWLRRIALLAASVFFVLFANLVRTTFLVWAAATRGLHQMEDWHDAAGNIVMFIVLPGLLVLAWLLKPKGNIAEIQTEHQTQTLPPFARWLGVGAIVWLLLAQLATEIWYRHHESGAVPNVRWSVVWPIQNPQFQKTSLPQNSLAILRCSESESAAWHDREDNEWTAFLLRWKAGQNSAQLAKGHRPDICFPATGARLAEDFGRVIVDVDGLKLPFRHQSFETGRTTLNVFYCLWSDAVSSSEDSFAEDGSQASRIRAVLAGNRNLGQQVLEVVIRGPRSGVEAASLLKAQLPSLIRKG